MKKKFEKKKKIEFFFFWRLKISLAQIFKRLLLPWNNKCSVHRQQESIHNWRTFCGFVIAVSNQIIIAGLSPESKLWKNYWMTFLSCREKLKYVPNNQCQRSFLHVKKNCKRQNNFLQTSILGGLHVFCNILDWLLSRGTSMYYVSTKRGGGGQPNAYFWKQGGVWGGS